MMTMVTTTIKYSNNTVSLINLLKKLKITTRLNVVFDVEISYQMQHIDVLGQLEAAEMVENSYSVEIHKRHL